MLGLLRIHSLHHYALDLARTEHLLRNQLDFACIARSHPDLDARQRSRVYAAGDCRIVVSEPVGKGGRAWRFLQKHPAGIGAVVLQVADIDAARAFIEERGGTLIEEVQRSTGYATFSITTPLGDTTFRFVQVSADAPPFPNCQLLAHEPANRFGFTGFDHVTCNLPTMAPALLWMEHVLGFERYWKVDFHTAGSGLRSVVMWDPSSGVKFAFNEPARPAFRASQINVFAEEHRGPGVQHAALTTTDIRAAVRGLQDRGVAFMSTPSSYYDMLPERLERIGVGGIDEPIDELRELGVLVDGDRHRAYMLQVFLREASALHNDPEAGPFFFELIERKGDRGFGAGNFQALYESIARQQQAEGRI